MAELTNVLNKSRYINRMTEADLNYRLQASDHLRSICAEFFRKFGLTDFCYSQFDEQGNQIDLCTNTKWINFYFENRHKIDISVVENMWELENNLMCYWNWPIPSLHQSDIFNALNRHNMSNGLSVFEKHNNQLSIWCFATMPDNTQIRGSYLDNLDEFKLFAREFMRRGKELIDNCTKIKTISSKKKITKDLYQPVMCNSINNFKKQIQDGGESPKGL